MANRQTKALRKKGECTHNMGATTIVSKVEHGRNPFLQPDQAIRLKKETGRRSWRINKVHPDNPKKRD